MSNITQKPLIFAKAALQSSQIEAKLDIGCDGLEIQLLGELLGSNGGHDWLNASQVFDLSHFDKYPISILHAPLIPGHDDVLLERIVDFEDYTLLKSIFSIAEYFGKVQNKKIGVVVHSELYKEYLEDLGGAWIRLNSCVQELLETFPHTELYIENVSPLRGIGKGKSLHLANNCMFDNVEMVQALRETIGTDRIGTVLDTCHQMLTEKYIGALYDLIGDVPKPDLSMEAYMRNNAPYLKLMHICDMQGSGYGKGRHGIPFNLETSDRLYKILDLHTKFAPTCNITLEVEEKDFLIADGYRQTKELVDAYYRSKMI